MLAPDTFASPKGAHSLCRNNPTHPGTSDSATAWNDFPPDLRPLLSHCFLAADAPWPFIPQRVHVLRLVNFCHLSPDESVSRVDQATALVGNRWLSALAFLQGFARHVRSCLRLGGMEETNEHYLASHIFQESLFLANAAEIVARTAGLTNSLPSWLAGILLGGAQIGELLKPHNPNRKGGVAFRPTTVRDLAQFLSLLQAPLELQLPAVSSDGYGPWSSLGAAEKIARANARVSWAESSLSTVPTAHWPPAITKALQSKIAGVRESSMAFARHTWDDAVHHE